MRGPWTRFFCILFGPGVLNLIASSMCGFKAARNATGNVGVHRRKTLFAASQFRVAGIKQFSRKLLHLGGHTVNTVTALTSFNLGVALVCFRCFPPHMTADAEIIFFQSFGKGRRNVLILALSCVDRKRRSCRLPAID